MRSRRGFTLVEVMVAASITSIVMAGAVSFLVGGYRMVQAAYAESELTLRTRAIREKILFHIAPAHNNKAYSGILSGQPVNALAVGNNKIDLTSSAIELTTGAEKEQVIQLVQKDAEDGRSRFSNSGETGIWKDGWLTISDVGSGTGQVADCGYLPDDAVVDDILANNNIYFIKLHAKLGDIEHSERLVIPVFGKEQVKNETSVFHDNLLQ